MRFDGFSRSRSMEDIMEELQLRGNALPMNLSALMD
jgi:hypothetical protein